MSCYIEDEVDYEIFEITEENCNSSTDELNVILTSSSQDRLSDITQNKNATLEKAESAYQESKSCSNATEIAKEHELKAEGKKGEIKNTADKKTGDKKVDVEKNEVVKKGDVKNSVHYYQRQPSYTIASRTYVTPHFKGQQQHNYSKYPSSSMKSTYVDRRVQDEVLNKKRREEEESWRRRQQEGGLKRKHTDGPRSEAKRQHTDASTNERKRTHNDRRPLHDSNRRASQSRYRETTPFNDGLSIRDAGKAKASTQERMNDGRRDKENEERTPKESLQQRTRDVRKEEERNHKAPTKTPTTSRLQRREQASPMSKKVENGKSSELLITNLNENTTFNGIKKLVDDSNAVAQITYKKGESTSKLLFESIDAAVMFRRKYNRSKMGDSHVNIAFKK